MLFLLGGDKKKAAKECRSENNEQVKQQFLAGKFPVVTTTVLDNDRKVGRGLGLVVCRGYDSEETFFGMASRALNKGAHGIVGYQENIAFHPDGSKYFTCYGTAVQFEVAQTMVPTARA